MRVGIEEIGRNPAFYLPFSEGNLVFTFCSIEQPRRASNLARLFFAFFASRTQPGLEELKTVPVERRGQKPSDTLIVRIAPLAVPRD